MAGQSCKLICARVEDVDVVKDERMKISLSSFGKTITCK